VNRVLAVAAITLSLSGSAGRASVATSMDRPNEAALPKELEGIGIDEKPGSVLPQDLTFRDQDGKSVRLGEYLEKDKPVILVLAYYRCPMLCSLVLNGLGDGLRELAWVAGERFRVVTVSIDPSDTSEMAQKKRENQLASYGRKGAPRGWDFLVGNESDIKRLADLLGFRYRYDRVEKQYAHAAGAFVFTPDGRLSRTLYGISFPARSLRLALTEAAGGKLGSAWDKVLLFCYHYDPAARGYVLGARRIMKLGGVLTILSLGLFFWLLTRNRNMPARRAA
jgi:protein SCO1/2